METKQNLKLNRNKEKQLTNQFYYIKSISIQNRVCLE